MFNVLRNVSLIVAALAVLSGHGTTTASDCDQLPCDAFPAFELVGKPSASWNVRGEYLMWWSRGADSPALVTTSDPASLRSEAGVIGNPTTEVLFGNESLNDGMRNGVRLSVDRLISDLWSVHGEGFYVGDADDDFNRSSNGLPILARPYVSAQTTLNDSELVAFPSILEGSIAVETDSQIMGFELGASRLLSMNRSTRVSFFTGYRFIEFQDRLSVREDLESIDLGGLVPLGTTFVVNDSFEAENQFHGVNFRIDIEKQIQRWELSFQPSLAFGSMSRDLSIAGQTRTQIPGLDPSFFDGGLLAQPTNIGSDSSSTFTVVPELRLSLGREVVHGLRFDVGYTFLLLPETIRAAEQIDANVNNSQIGGGTLVGVASPVRSRDTSHTWNQSLTFSVAFQH